MNNVKLHKVALQSHILGIGEQAINAPIFFQRQRPSLIGTFFA